MIEIQIVFVLIVACPAMYRRSLKRLAMGRRKLVLQIVSIVACPVPLAHLHALGVIYLDFLERQKK